MNILKSLEVTEKRSRFIGYLIKIESEDDMSSALAQIKNEHSKARHILRASRYKNRYGVYISEASEDREPISSMKKTRELMERKDIKDVSVIVVRYFGGTELGASNLDRIYFSLSTDLLASLNTTK